MSLLYWFAALPWPVRGLIGACIGASSMVLLTETVRWLLGRGFFQ